MSAPLVGYLADGTVLVLGVEDATLARSIMIEELIERDDLDNFGVCTEADKSGVCNLKEGITCPACTEFLTTIYPVTEVKLYPAFTWKEM